MVLPRSGTGWLLERNQLRSVHEAERLDINSQIRASSLATMDTKLPQSQDCPNRMPRFRIFARSSAGSQGWGRTKTAKKVRFSRQPC